MSQQSNKVKRRIATVSSTQKITNAMKLIASVKLSKMDKEFKVQQTYFNAVRETFDDCFDLELFKFNEIPDILPLKEFKNATKRLVILVTSNLGLCGAYNYNVFKKFKEIYKENDEIIVIGINGLNELKKYPEIKIDKTFVHFGNNFTQHKANIIKNYILKKYETGEYSKVLMVHTKYVNSLVFRAKCSNILPLEVKDNHLSAKNEPIYEAYRDETLEYVANKFVQSKIFKDIFNSLISEESSRRNAMDNADKNADELIEKLQLEYNKARQAAITQELTEVVSGSNAVK